MLSSLLKTTCDLVAERGYEGATISRICEVSGIRRSSVYWRFADKESLVAAAVAAPYADLVDRLLDLPTPELLGDEWAEAVAEAIYSTLLAADARRSLVKAGLLLKAQGLGGPSKHILARAEHTEAALSAWLGATPAIKTEGDEIVPHLTWMITRLVEGTMLGTTLGGALDPRHVRDLAPGLLASALRG